MASEVKFSLAINSIWECWRCVSRSMASYTCGSTSASGRAILSCSVIRLSISMPLKLGDLGHAAQVAAAFKLRLQESVDHPLRVGRIGIPRPERQYVQVIMRASHADLFHRGADRGANA